MSAARERASGAGRSAVTGLLRLVLVTGALLTLITSIFWAWSLVLRFHAGDTIEAISNPTLVKLCRRISVEADWKPPPTEPEGGVVPSTGESTPIAQTDFAEYYIATVTGYWMKTDDDAGRYIGPYSGYNGGHIGFSTYSVVRIADKDHADGLPIGGEKVTACGVLEVPHQFENEEGRTRGRRFIWSAIG